jgi:hypothetical protein
MFDHIIGNMAIRGTSPTKKIMHVTFDLRSKATTFRKRDGRYVWSINIYNQKASGVRIEPFEDMDWDQLLDAFVSRTNFDRTDLTALIAALQKYSFGKSV